MIDSRDEYFYFLQWFSSDEKSVFIHGMKTVFSSLMHLLQWFSLDGNTVFIHLMKILFSS